MRGAGGEKFVDQRGQRGIVETFAEALVEADTEFFVDVLEFGPGQIHELLPDGAVLRIALLEFDQFLARGLVHGGIGLLERVDLAVKAGHFRNGIARQGVAIKEMFPPVEDLAELRAPVAEMVVGDDLVSGEPRDAGQRVAEDGAADVADMHRLGDVGRAEVDDDALRVPGFRHPAAGVTGQGAELLRDPLRFEAEVEEAGARDFRFVANVAGFKIIRDLGGEFTRVGFGLLGQDHGGVGLVVAEARVGRGGDFAALGGQPAGDHGRVQPLGQHDLRRGAHSAVAAAAGKDLQDGLRVGRRGQLVAHGAVVEELGNGGQRAQVNLELVAGDNKQDDEMDQLVVERVELDAGR